MTVQHAATGAAQLTPPVSSTLHRPILVATDGTEASDPALRAAQLVAAQLGAPVRVLSIVAPQPYIVPSPTQMEIPPVPLAELVADRTSSVRTEMQRVLGSDRTWPLDVRSGVVSLELADAVRESNAQLVVTGLRHHGPVDRLIRGETPLGVLNAAHVPTLAVPPGADRLPRNVLVAVSPGDASVDAACFARPLMASAEAVYLVHVQTQIDMAPPMTTPAMDQAYHEAVQRAFDRVVAALELAPSVHVERKVFLGNVAHELLDFAELAKVDLVVTGHRRRPLIERMLNGGTARRLFHGATTWLLMVPEDARLRERLVMNLPEEEANRWLLDRATWPTFLDDFTRRNAGRRAELEVHDYLGVQTVVKGYPLLGLDYERDGARVDIMLGDTAGTERHLRHSIRYTTAIELHRAPDGRDGVLRVADRLGQTLLTLTS